MWDFRMFGLRKKKKKAKRKSSWLAMLAGDESNFILYVVIKNFRLIFNVDCLKSQFEKWLRGGKKKKRQEMCMFLSFMSNPVSFLNSESGNTNVLSTLHQMLHVLPPPRLQILTEIGLC